MKRAAFGLSFAWIFAIIAGAVILFLAIYFASQLIDMESHKINTQTTKQISNMLDPLATTVEQGKTSSIGISTETRIYASCNEEGDFGNAVLQLSEKFGFRDEWSKKGEEIWKQNSYVFAEDVVEGDRFYFFTKPFDMPFKVADNVMVFSDAYCFVNAPEWIEEEVMVLGESGNMKAVSDIDSCSSRSVTVCLSGNCDIEVQCSGDCESGFVRKGNDEMYFIGDLIYPAIFASEDNYDCGIERLMMRLEHVATLYSEKARFTSVRGCNSGLRTELALLASNAKNYDGENDLSTIADLAEDIENKNGRLGCRLF